MRNFETGATRNNSENKPDYAAFLSMSAMKAFGEYMHSHRTQADGTVRDGDNWKKGIPIDCYKESGTRHWFDVLTLLESGEKTLTNYDGEEVDLQDCLSAMMFNVQGMLHEVIKERNDTN